MLVGCAGSVSPREQALEATIAALQAENTPATSTLTTSQPAVSASTATAVDQSQPGKYIGTAYPPLPEGWKQGRQTITFSSAEGEYAIVELWQEDQQMLWFLKSTGRDAQGHLTWTVVDMLVRSEIKEKGGFLWSACKLGDKPDDEIVALGESKTPKMDPIHLAWRADHNTGHFEPISIEGLICVDENAVN